MMNSGKQSSDSTTQDQEPKCGHINPTQLEAAAWRMAAKKMERDVKKNFKGPGTRQRIADARRRIVEKSTKRGRAHQIMHATVHYVGDVAITNAKSKLLPEGVSVSRQIAGN